MVYCLGIVAIRFRNIFGMYVCADCLPSVQYFCLYLQLNLLGSLDICLDIRYLVCAVLNTLLASSAKDAQVCTVKSIWVGKSAQEVLAQTLSIYFVYHFE